MRIQTREKALIGLVAGIAAFAAFYMLAIAPQHRRITSLDRQITTERTALTSAQAAFATGHGARMRLQATRLQYAAALRAVPAQSDVPTLLRLLQSQAAAAQVRLQSVAFGTGSSSTSTSATPATSASAASSGSTATTAAAPQSIPISLTLLGGYSALDRLVRRLDALVTISHGELRARGPLVGVSDVSVSEGSGQGSLSISLTATVYQTSAVPANAANTASTGGTSS